ncbi:hypothetical protein PAB09_01145 [Corynebacterium sp. SCR221107]|uniref:hypothetical protein n=1 Tax=Corynebacterium sp. SCR221107 TaxID=3017361 RepID=UPI0022EC4E6B|nr:hypothetical protein [Corynebacterium sp. SCR221107]WBT08091.1 hypothetical protein PAB09_09305 [Corynebacterium sp. SCR221107]WBT08988.1 hypothetical protein PAB09_01145 [Corynebacterium sp. SCR221107]
MSQLIRARICTPYRKWVTTHIATEVQTGTSTGRRLVLHLDDGTRIEMQLGRAIAFINQIADQIEGGGA